MDTAAATPPLPATPSRKWRSPARFPNGCRRTSLSPVRLVREDPLFLSDRNGLWRVAASLCRQLHAVNRRLADALTLHAAPAGTPVLLQVSAPPGRSRST